MISTLDVELADRLHRLDLLSAKRIALCLQELSARKDGASLAELVVQSGLLQKEDVDNVIFGETGGRNFHDYQIIDTVGQGAFAWVYLAREPAMGQRVALKVLRQKFLGSIRVIKRMKREAQLGSIVKHPNVAGVYARIIKPDEVFMTMEFVNGLPLGKIIKRLGPLPRPVAVYIAMNIAEALKGLNQFCIVHRDIKPANILVDISGVAKLVDFGVAKRLAVDDGIPVKRLLLGTRGYVSPEQIEDPRWVDVRSDIFSLGVTLFDMLAGTISARVAREDKEKSLTAQRPKLELMEPMVEPDLIDIVDKMTQLEPIRRYQDPEELSQALQAALKTSVADATAGVQWVVSEAMYREATGHLWLERGALAEEEEEKESTELITTTIQTV